MLNNDSYNWLRLCFGVMIEYIPERFETAEMTGRFRTVAEHIDVLGGYFNPDETTDDDVAKYYSMAGIGHKEISSYDISLDYYRKAVAIRERNGNEQSLAVVFNNIAVLHNIKANHILAAEYNIRAIEIAEKYNTPPRELIIAYNNLTSIYMKSYEYDDALEWNAKAVLTLERNGLADAPIAADVHLTKASIHYVREEFKEALILDLKAIDVLKAHYPEEHADIGTAYNSVAREYFSLMKFDMALDYYFKALRIYEAVYGEYDSDTAAVCGNISKTYMAMTNYENALDWCLKTLDIQKETLGEGHPETMLRHSFASEIYEVMELYDEANNHLHILLSYYQNAGVDKIVRIVCERLAGNYERMGNAAETAVYRNMAGESKHV